MKRTFINSKEDMDWLFVTHLKNLKSMRPQLRSAVIIGNEDSPSEVQLYTKKNPIITDVELSITF
jgi:hypothetical protein